MNFLYKTIPNFVLAATLAFTLVACETDMFFDEGHIHRTFDGEPEVALYPVGDENPDPDDLSGNEADDGDAISIEVQRINDHGDGDLHVHFSLDDELSTAVEGEHFELETSSPVTIPSGQWDSDIEIDLIEGNITHGGRDTLAIRIDDVDADSDEEFSPSDNLSVSTWFVED